MLNLGTSGRLWRGDLAGSLVLSRAQARAVDEAAEQELGIPGIVLMENAATALEDAAVAMLDLLGKGDSTIVVICGGGNNGGDGFALARRLHVLFGDTSREGAARVEALALIAANRMRGDALTNRVIAERMGLVTAADGKSSSECFRAAMERARAAPRVLIVDALLGTGLDRPLSPEHTAAARWINGLRRAHPKSLVLAVDVPTGLDAQTGALWSDDAVLADVTVTLGALKRGLLRECGSDAVPTMVRQSDTPPAQSQPSCIGELYVGGIGIPHWFLRRVAARAG
ncbi:MAG: NAD(P)H-hydrate epimerase [Phycisphaerales bacterium]